MCTSQRGTCCELSARLDRHRHTPAPTFPLPGRCFITVMLCAQGQLIDDHIKNGTIVPVEITCRLLVDAIRANGGKVNASALAVALA